MKTFLTTLTLVTLTTFLLGAFFVVADFIVPCPKTVPEYTSCSVYFPNGPPNFVKRPCSSTQNTSQEECVTSAQDVVVQELPIGSKDSSSSETFTSTDVDNTKVKCRTYYTCKWMQDHCALDNLTFTYPSGIVLYKAKYCSTGEDVPQD
jgi:hypothetical protein